MLAARHFEEISMVSSLKKKKEIKKSKQYSIIPSSVQQDDLHSVLIVIRNLTLDTVYYLCSYFVYLNSASVKENEFCFILSIFFSLFRFIMSPIASPYSNSPYGLSWRSRPPLSMGSGDHIERKKQTLTDKGERSVILLKTDK